MAKPVINHILSFSALVGTTVSFSLSGEVSYGNKIYVYNSKDLSLAYEYPKVLKAGKSPVQLSCIIPANVLKNGERYFAQIQTVNVSGKVSTISDKKSFYCLDAPRFSFIGVANGQKVEASHIDVSVMYGQSNGERLQSYRFHLYDKNKVLINESSLMYDTDNLVYRYKGFATGQTYYIRATGTTIRGLIADTGFVELFAQYTVKKDYSQINLVNHYHRGYIEIATSIRLIGFNLNNKDYLFVSDQFVDLTGRNPDYKSELIYDNGFEIEGPFSMWLKLYGANPQERILTMQNSTGESLTISFYVYDDKCYFKCEVSDGITKYIRYTKRVNYSKTAIYTIFLRRYQNNLIDFRIFDNNSSAQTGDYTLYQDSEGNLFVKANGYMPYYKYVSPALYSTENARYDSATGNLYLRI